MGHTGSIRLTAAVAGITLALAACGGGGDDGSDDAQDLLDELGIDDGSTPDGPVDEGDVDEGNVDDGEIDLGDLDLGDLDLGDLDLGDLDLGDLGGLFDGSALEEVIEKALDGDIDIEFGEDGFSVESEDGSLSIDGDGTFTVVDEDGDETTGEIDIDADGGDLSIDGQDAGVEFSTGSELPADWPSDVPVPDGIAITSSTSLDEDGAASIILTGTSSGDPVGWANAYGEQLQDAGFNEESRFVADDDVTAFYLDDTWNVAVIATGASGSTSVSVSVNPAD
jgi:hypothetical protein